MRVGFSGVHERCSQAGTNESRSSVDPIDGLDIARGDFSIRGSLPSEDVCGIVPSNPANGISAVNDEGVRFAQMTLNLDDADVTGCGSHGEGAPKISVGSGVELTLARIELSETVDDICTVRDKGNGALRGQQAIQKGIKFRSIDRLAAAV